MTAAYIINRLPSKTTDNKTPFEILYERKPDYEHMKVFGCLAYFLNTDTKGDKFELRGKPGVFLGYPPGTKGYKIYDTVHDKIVVSRNVIFAESIFPYGNSKPIDKEENNKLFSFPPWYYTPTDGTSEITSQTGSPNVGESHESGPETLYSSNTSQHEKEHEPDQNENGPPITNELPTQQSHQTENENKDRSHESTINSGPNAQQNLQAEMMEEIVHEESEPIRQQRNRTRPKRLDDFVVDLPPSIDNALPTAGQEPSTVHSIANFISYKQFSNSHKAFLAAIGSIDEPKFFKQVVQDENWRKAMQKEIRALEENGTWTLETLPEGKWAIDSKWVYKVKFQPNGEV
ncbi:uncharacterized protein LOC143556966 [Bidens hawaiensis]|uniref:uncharacterized protein LOC143556966 n=1 Tax=Bidens hawaiensis TaxID=980011 RepID=UPI00404AEF02